MSDRTWAQICATTLKPGRSLADGRYRVQSVTASKAIIERVATGKTVAITAAKVAKVAAWLAIPGYFIIKRSIDYTVAKEYCIVAALGPSRIVEATDEVGRAGYRSPKS
jgi:hypothetical protein